MVCFSFIVKKTPLLADEYTHYLTINEIEGNTINSETFSRNAQLPGYYFLIAAISYLTKLTSIFQLRMISLVFSFLSIIVFYLLAQKINRQQTLLKTAQYFFFPLFFVFFFLLYGDICSLLFLMLSFLFVLDKRYFFAGIFGLISLIFRQNNIVWLGFFCVYILAEEYNFKLQFQNIWSYLKDISLFILGFAGVLFFIVINKSPAMAQTSLNPIVFRQENLFFMLFIYFFVFSGSSLSRERVIL